MTTIKILPEILSNKIAAGEVVERPSSVVKELVENAIDAASRRIHIEVEKGGRSLIRVADDGLGMAHDDALLAIERYATSKIYTDEDLFSISTLGFRGEALPSIASVSRFSLITREDDSASGTEIHIEGGKIIRVSETGAPKGTMMTVKHLFFNTPARRKFLKTVNTEMGHIADIVQSMALGHPDIRFKLTHNGKTVYHFTPSSDPVSRVADVLGKDVKNDLYPVTANENGVAITGWAASDRHTRSTSRGIYVFVNKRFVRDKVISHALFEGFSGRLMKGQFPLAVLFIDLDPVRVDVNVHPTKHEVRFLDAKQVHDAVAKAVANALRQTVVPTRPPLPVAPALNSDFPDHPRTINTPGSFRETVRSYPKSKKSPWVPGRMPEKPPEKGIPEQKDLWEKRFFGDLSVIGQLHNSYIVCQSADGIILIDQHAAHERVVYEEMKSRDGDKKIHRQKLLIPETLDLGYREAEILNSLVEDLDRAGMEIEPFGGNTFALKAVPAILANQEINPIIMEIIEKMINIGFKPGVGNAIDECHIIMACHSAIRANQALTGNQMTALLHQLDGCENPGNCPHGRPTWVRWTVTDLEKQFRRIV
jgi:DNA mismatch repair protein MutL